MVYHRTSFHLAGSEEKLTSVVSHLVHDAQQMFSLSQQDPQQQPQEERHDHPQVGLIDHIAVMPLLIQQNRTDNDTSGSANQPEKANDDHKAFVPASPWGRAARAIGNSILLRQQQGQDEARPTIKTRVLFYGDADCHQTSLAEVRRNKTHFFQSKPATTTASHPIDTCCVGAPSQFVENYNIRLTRHCTKQVAMTLTQALRESSHGGLPGVEALTLPYSHGRWEVACNLLQPSLGSTEAMDQKVQEWVQQQPRLEEEKDDDDSHFHRYVEQAYRVGTTAEQCLDALDMAWQSIQNSTSKTNSNLDDDNGGEALREYNKEVQSKLKGFLSSVS